MSRLSILQYNVHKSRNVMMPLLASKNTKNVDILAIQEPWLDPKEPATYCPKSSEFYTLFDVSDRRTCIMVNKRINTDFWSIILRDRDQCSLRLRTDNGVIWIHNCYSQPPEGLRNDSFSTPIHYLEELLALEGQHILLGDFNVHHYEWNGITGADMHDLADELLIKTRAYNLALLTPVGEVTFQGRGSTTIDLAFATTGVQNRVINCQVDEEFCHGSDHNPVLLQLDWTVQETSPTPRRAWSNIDRKAIGKMAAATLIPPELLRTPSGIDWHLEHLHDRLQEIVEEHVPWLRPSTRAEAWWDQKVKEAVKAQRAARRKKSKQHSSQAEREFLAASDYKRRVIRDSKRRLWRSALYNASDTNQLWNFTRWGRGATPPPPIMPPLKGPEGLVYSTEEKSEALRSRFYASPEADTADISEDLLEESSFGEKLSMMPEIDTKEISAILSKRKNTSAPGYDGIPYGFLKALGPPFATYMAEVITVCWEIGYFPDRYKEAKTVVIRKPNKPSYQEPKAWRPIALLSTVGKIIETATANRLRQVAEANDLLPQEQMGFRNKRSCETALDLLTSQIKAIWEPGTYIASLLSMDISGAFDSVVPRRLLEVLKRKGLPYWFVKHIESYTNNRRTTLVLPGGESEVFRTGGGVPQGSPLSVMLFLFYNAELFDICRRPELGISTVGFADDLSILTYSKSTALNCRKLETVNSDCMAWAKRFGIKFEPTKYDLIHFTRATKRFDTSRGIQIGEAIIAPSQQVRLLGVYLDPKLKWKAHLQQIRLKMTKHIGALSKIAASTWGPTLASSRKIYTAVVRPGMIYASPIWHRAGSEPKGIVKELSRIQNKCLRIISGAYRATAIDILEIETRILPLHIYLNYRTMCYSWRVMDTEAEEARLQSCQQIRGRIAAGSGPAPDMVRNWVVKEMEKRNTDPEPYTDGAWAKLRQEAMDKQSNKGRASWGVTELPDNKILDLHIGMNKAESSILIQLRTGKIGLARFLHKSRVPGYDSEECRCGFGVADPQHFLLDCPLYSEERRRAFGEGEMPSYNRMVSQPGLTRRVARWAIRTGELRQFELASRLNYSEELA